MAIKTFIISLIVFHSAALSGQEFLIINSNRELFRVDMESCTAEYVAYVQVAGGGSISDITYTNDGQLWGITTDGRLLVIDEDTGITTLAYTIPNSNSPFFTSLVADREGRIFTAGGNGDLYVFDVNTTSHTYLGNIGYGSAGDLTFYRGQLIMASITNQMIDVDIENPENSTVRMNFNVGGQVFGIVTFVEDCENTVTYATNDAANGEAFQIDFATSQLSHACNLRMRIFGAASRLEFLAADPVLIEGVNTTPTSCASPEGVIEVLASGGNGPLAYSLDNINFQPSRTFTGLPPGDYSVYVRDGEGCAASREATVGAIGEAPRITGFLVEQDSCGVGIGSILVEVEGGLLPYQYVLNGGAPADGPQFTGLPGGEFTISVIDGQGCSATRDTIIPGEPGPQIERIGIKPCGPGRSALSVDASGGVGALLYSLDGASGQPAPEFTGLDAGTIQVSVTDEAGCTAIQLVDIPLVPVLEVTTIEIQACGPGNSRLTVAADGGSGPFTYSLNGGPAQSSGAFQSLSPGAYSILATDRNGCTATATATIPEYSPPRISGLEITPSQCGSSNGRIRVETQGGTPPFLYTLGGEELPVPEFAGLFPGRFLLSVTDAEGCSTSDSVTVTQQCPIYFPNVFSPNEDGRNDRFELYSGAEVQVLSFRIFNRWGGLAYEQNNFSSMEKGRFWDGRFEGEPAPAGLYVFQVEVRNAADEQESFEGEVLLVR